MALFAEGSFDRIGLTYPSNAAVRGKPSQQVSLPTLLASPAAREFSFELGPVRPEGIATTTDPWSLYLEAITLLKNAEGFIRNLFHPTNEIYFTSIAWDYSGANPIVWPPTGTDKDEWIIPLKKGETREYIGDGVDLWPSNVVAGALNVVILVYENDDEVRHAGEVLVDIHDAVDKSKLKDLVLAISASPQLAIGVAVAAAVSELIGVVGQIMKKNGNDYLDLFEGSFGVEKEHTSETFKYRNSAARIRLDLTVAAAGD